MGRLAALQPTTHNGRHGQGRPHGRQADRQTSFPLPTRLSHTHTPQAGRHFGLLFPSLHPLPATSENDGEKTEKKEEEVSHAPGMVHAIAQGWADGGGGKQGRLFSPHLPLSCPASLPLLPLFTFYALFTLMEGRRSRAAPLPSHCTSLTPLYVHMAGHLTLPLGGRRREKRMKETGAERRRKEGKAISSISYLFVPAAPPSPS